MGVQGDARTRPRANLGALRACARAGWRRSGCRRRPARQRPGSGRSALRRAPTPPTSRPRRTWERSTTAAPLRRPAPHDPPARDPREPDGAPRQGAQRSPRDPGSGAATASKASPGTAPGPVASSSSWAHPISAARARERDGRAGSSTLPGREPETRRPTQDGSAPSAWPALIAGHLAAPRAPRRRRLRGRGCSRPARPPRCGPSSRARGPRLRPRGPSASRAGRAHRPEATAHERVHLRGFPAPRG